MKNLKSIIVFLMMCVGLQIQAADIVYTKNDSVRIEKLIADAARQPKGSNIILYIGKRLEGVPYVAQTLERNKTEKLQVNSTELDCTTFVENVLAMYLCVKNHQFKFKDFCHYLRMVRYDKGEVSYPTRLHYFSSWIMSNTEKGFVKEVQGPVPPYSATQTVLVNFMTKHTANYPMLKNNKVFIKKIGKAEKAVSGKTFKFIPSKMLKNVKALRKGVKDGDIIALTTKKAGLDISHVGYAIWHKDGLHLLNASSLAHKVVDDKETLYRYSQKHPSMTGIRVIRVL